MPNTAAVQEVVPAVLPTEFAALYAAEVQYVLRSLRRLGVHERDLEDVAHDLFLAAYRKWGEFDPSRPVRPWLFGFAFRMAADHRRLSRHKYETHNEIESVDPRRLQDDELADKQARRMLLLALEELAYDRRGIFVMHDLDGHAMPEIARAFSIPLNTAYSRLRLARRDFEIAVRHLSEPTTATEAP